MALGGRVRGGLLKDWGVHIERRFGRGAPEALVEALGFELAIRPAQGAWYPVWVQLRLTELIIEHHLDGDAAALVPMIWEDATRSAGPIATAALRLAGPVRILRRAPGSFSGLYDQVEATTEINDDRIAVRFTGPEHVDQPTWQLLQATSLAGLTQMAGLTDWSLTAGSPGPGTFDLELTL
jgi:hypothetical protein